MFININYKIINTSKAIISLDLISLALFFFILLFEIISLAFKNISLLLLLLVLINPKVYALTEIAFIRKY